MQKEIEKDVDQVEKHFIAFYERTRGKTPDVETLHAFRLGTKFMWCGFMALEAAIAKVEIAEQNKLAAQSIKTKFE